MPGAVKGKGGKAETVRAKVTSKGQITLPASLRRRLGVKAGDTVVFESHEGNTTIAPSNQKDVFERYRGIGTGGIGGSRKAVLRWVREIRGEL